MLRILARYAANVTAHPGERKYRRLKLSNPVFLAIWGVEGATTLLLLAGWQTDLKEGWLELGRNHLDGGALAAAVNEAMREKPQQEGGVVARVPAASTPPAGEGGVTRRCKVIVHGLVKRPDLNGAEGIAIVFVVAKQRWRVKTGAKAYMVLKPSNLRVVSSADEATAADAAAATARLLPPPPSAKYFLNGGSLGTLDGTIATEFGAVPARELAAEVARWLVQVVHSTSVCTLFRHAPYFVA